MRRNIYNDLLVWKSSANRKPLLLLGARQVGKTWIMRHFGKQEYKNVAYVNCDDEVRMKHLFESDYDIERILLALQAITGVKIEEGNTLIILDEIQEIARGLHSLKYFCEKAPGYHVMVAGSLLGVTIGKGESFPVGKVDMLQMYPMTFEEFVDAMGDAEYNKIISSRDWFIIETMRTKLIDLLRQYYVGGMPEVVSAYITRKDLAEVRTLQQKILQAYRKDISKHTTARETIRIGQVLDSIPSQLAKENKKFIFGAVKKGARAADFELAIQWLIDAGIVHKVTRIKEARMPLKFYEDQNAFKLFFIDCGLLSCMVDVPVSQILVGDNVFVEFKGAFTEQYVLQQMKAYNKLPYYWSNDRTPAEIDFVIQYEDRILPIEVKAEENVRSKSLAQFIKDNEGLKGLRISMRGYIDQSWMENIPLYGLDVFMRGSVSF